MRGTKLQTSLTDLHNFAQGHRGQLHGASSTINWRISGGRLRAASRGCFRGLAAKKLTMPCSSKASALRSRVGRVSPVSSDRFVAGSRDLDDGAQQLVGRLLRED